MKSFLLPFLLVSAAGLAQTAPSPSGAWKVHTSIADHELDIPCTFTPKGNDLTGTCTTDTGSAPLTGKVDGKKVTWTYQSEYEGTKITVTFTGNAQSDTSITGSVSVPEFGAEGDFTASPEASPAPAPS